jgi:hypothetical protein
MTKQNKSKKNTSLKRNGNSLSKISTKATPTPSQPPTSAPSNPLFPAAVPQVTSKKTYKGFHGFLDYIHDHILFLNSSRFFAGVVMILLNIGSKFISVQFSKSTEEYLKFSITKQILVFAMAWMATRDIYTSLVLTAVFVVLSEYLFNEESRFCIVPYQYRVLNSTIDINNDGVVSQEELNQAIQILEKAKKEKQQTSGPSSGSVGSGMGNSNGVGGSNSNKTANPNGMGNNLNGPQNIGDNIKNTITKYMNGN